MNNSINFLQWFIFTNIGIFRENWKQLDFPDTSPVGAATDCFANRERIVWLQALIQFSYVQRVNS